MYCHKIHKFFPNEIVLASLCYYSIAKVSFTLYQWYISDPFLTIFLSIKARCFYNIGKVLVKISHEQPLMYF